MSCIKSELAFNQKIDFEPIFPVLEEYKATDGDLIGKLVNKISFVLEVKKKTDEHAPEKIKISDQLDTIRSAIKESTYLIYATHEEEISDKMINSRNLTIQYIERFGKEEEFGKGMNLVQYLNKIGSVGMYYIRVKYPEQEKEQFAIRSPKDNVWTSEKYWSGINCFSSEEECKEYINKRYEKEFNQSYIYSVWYAESISSVKLIHRYTYPETIGL